MTSGKVNTQNKQTSTTMRLAFVFQQWSEICSRALDLEISPELQYYMAGRTDAHAMDASRARTASSVLDPDRPHVELTQFSKAYEILVQMLASFSGAEHDTGLVAVEFEAEERTIDGVDEARVEPPVEAPDLFQMTGTALQTLRERARQLHDTSQTSD